MKTGPRSVGHNGGFKRLTALSQKKFDLLVRTKGVQGAAKLIGIIPVTAEKMLYGGTANPEVIAKVEGWAAT